MVKAIKKFISIIFSIILMISIIPLGTITTNAAQFDGGNGTTSSPYLISTRTQFLQIQNDLSAHYKLISDINVGSMSSLGETRDTSVGNKYKAFTGSLDGNGHELNNVTIDFRGYDDNTHKSFIGIFAYNNGIIKNLNITDCKINVQAHHDAFIGGIAGMNSGEISNCSFSGTITFTKSLLSYGYNMAGIAAWSDGKITNCKNYGKIICFDGYREVYLGGIVATNFQSEIINCENYGEIFAEPSIITTRLSVAGIVAHNSAGQISNCTNRGKINVYNPGTAKSYIGGIVAESWEGELNLCYNQGNIRIDNENNSEYKDSFGSGTIYAGGIAGSGQVKNSYNSSNIEMIGTSGGKYLGGIVGVLSEDSVVVNAYNTGNIDASTKIKMATDSIRIGGIAGANLGTIESTYNLGIFSSVSYNHYDNQTGGTIDLIEDFGLFGEVCGMNDGLIKNTSLYLTGRRIPVGFSSEYSSNSATCITKEELRSKGCILLNDLHFIFKASTGYIYPQIKGVPHYADYKEGDLDCDFEISDSDAVYLLYYTFLPDIYPINQDCDFNGDGEINDKDAVYLLYYTFLPDLYPLSE